MIHPENVERIVPNGARRLKPESFSLANRACGALTGNIAGSSIVKTRDEPARSLNGTERV